jgi:tetratricopeptide (TPR) repeat protein
MDKIYKWVSWNRRLLNGLAWGLSFFWIFVLAVLKLYTTGIGILFVLFIGFVSYFSRYCTNKMLQKTHALWIHHCDPYPYLKEVQRNQYYFKKHNALEFYTVYGSLLIQTGEYHKACDVLLSFPAKKLAKMDGSKQFYYYYALAEWCRAAGRREEAEKAYQKAFALYREEKNEVIKEDIAKNMIDLEISYHLFCGEYKESMEKRKRESDTLFDNVAHKMMNGEAYFYMGEYEKARECFLYVIAHGNRLYIVEEARDFLKKMNAEDSRNALDKKSVK